MNSQKLISWKFDDNAGFHLQVDYDSDYDSDNSISATGLDLYFEKDIVSIVCFNSNGGYYPHSGHLRRNVDENLNSIPEKTEKFSI